MHVDAGRTRRSVVRRFIGQARFAGQITSGRRTCEGDGIGRLRRDLRVVRKLSTSCHDRHRPIITAPSAYGLAGDTDSAIADYTKVIQMAPDNASAYDNRGRAYASKGDYTHAVEDVTKAHELMAKATAQPIMVTPKSPKTTKVTANAPNATKRKATLTPKAGTNVSKAAPGSNFWSWLNPWTDSADQVGGKNAKP